MTGQKILKRLTRERVHLINQNDTIEYEIKTKEDRNKMIEDQNDCNIRKTENITAHRLEYSLK